MRLFLLILLLVSKTIFYGQENGSVNEKLEEIALNLTSNLNSEKDKAWAIYDWVTSNIAYDVELYNRGQFVSYDISIAFAKDQEDFDKKYDSAVLSIVLDKKKAICDGYSRIFKALCDHSGLESEIVSGYAKSFFNMDLPKEFKTNHAWNVIKLDGKWYLIDSTWGSGFVDLKGSSFTKRQNKFYFLTPPDLLILDHYPKEMKYALLKENLTYEDFKNLPRMMRSGKTVLITEISPKNTPIVYDQTATIELTLSEIQDDQFFFVSETPTLAKRDLLGLTVTNKNYDSLSKIHTDLNLYMPMIEYTQEFINPSKIRFNIRFKHDSIRSIEIQSDFGSIEFPTIHKSKTAQRLKK